MSKNDRYLIGKSPGADQKPESFGEVGSATLWAMLFCTASLIAYLKIGRAFLDTHVPPFYHLLIVLTLAIVTIFTLGCSIHMIFMGDKSTRYLRRDLLKQTEELARFVIQSKKRIRDYEAEALRQAGNIRPHCLDCIGQARRIVNALGRRGDEVRKLLATRNKLDLIDAHGLLRKELVITENCMDSLIGMDPLPAVPADEWFSTVENLCEQIDMGFKRLKAAA